MSAKARSFAAVLLMAGFAGILAAPTAAAHDCRGHLPMDCGACSPSEPYHRHLLDLFVVTVVWCETSEDQATLQVQSTWGLGVGLPVVSASL